GVILAAEVELSLQPKGETTVRQVCGKGLVAVVLALILGLPVLVQGAEFDLSKFNQEAGLNLAYGKNTHGANVQLFSLVPHWGIFLMRPGTKMGPVGISFLVEGIISVANAEQTGFELGFTPMFRLPCLG
ncbi:MAG: hypothetical protein NTW80_00710, partial [Deltaproteobacteria bacterium]|nr:hypothetical protein [Deltaproteobacteria bacterium]